MQSTERDGRTGTESITISRALGDKVRACMQLMNTSMPIGWFAGFSDWHQSGN